MGDNQVLLASGTIPSSSRLGLSLDAPEHNQTAIITYWPISSLIELKKHGSKSPNAAFYQPVHM